jgi:NADP-dependent 3-hydroxy acid dehydrogenase YdfG
MIQNVKATVSTSGRFRGTARYLVNEVAKVRLGVRCIDRFDSSARILLFALSQQDNIDINKILFRPVGQSL